ncbi:uncharacterized protein LOC118190221 [Stegodyphus dumicola]|uniref:uncharacterized protein LOC118190221 n=1 Tax=Stegodyphus dumicola TaxID=202533 RepID=UPI0015A8D85A|nr:uncharacterized protein LOC118190221 [Stegodyphus dumicola]
MSDRKTKRLSGYQKKKARLEEQQQQSGALEKYLKTGSDNSDIKSDNSTTEISRNELYVYFSASNYRWSILLAHIPKLTLKPLSDTRWESRIEAITPLKTQLGEIYDALAELKDDETRDIITRTLANSLAEALENLENLKDYFVEIRCDEHFKIFMDAAKQIAAEVELEAEFPPPAAKRIGRRKRNFDYEHEDESILDPESSFKVNFYFKILDATIGAINERFQLLYQHINIFKILYNIHEYGDLKDNELKAHCAEAELALTDKKLNHSDINGAELFEGN